MHTLSYQQARSVVKDGDIIFIRGSTSSITQSIIMFFTRSTFSHVCIAFWVPIGGVPRLMCVEAQGGSARRILSLSYYQTSQMVVMVPPESWDTVCDTAVSRVAITSYGWLQAIYVGIRESALNWVGIRLPKAKFNGETCSEFVASVYNLDDIAVSPGKLFNIMNNSGCATRPPAEKKEAN